MAKSGGGAESRREPKASAGHENVVLHTSGYCDGLVKRLVQLGEDLVGLKTHQGHFPNGGTKAKQRMRKTRRKYSMF